MSSPTTHGDGLTADPPVDPALRAARRRAARAVRRLAVAMVEHAADPATLDAVAGQVEQMATGVASAPARAPVEIDLSRISFDPVADGGDISGPDYCVFSGDEHPAGMGARMWREGDRAIAEVTLTQLEGGPSGRAHGGVVAGLCDDLVRGLLMVLGVPAFTASLTVNLRAATPLGVPLRLEAWLDRHEGRKLWARIEVLAGGVPVADGEALMISFQVPA